MKIEGVVRPPISTTYTQGNSIKTFPLMMDGCTYTHMGPPPPPLPKLEEEEEKSPRAYTSSSSSS